MRWGEHDIAMAHPPSRFAEVAEKSKAKRAQLDATAASREAEKIRASEEERAARSAKFPREFAFAESVQAVSSVGEPSSDEEPVADFVEGDEDDAFFGPDDHEL